MKIKETNMYKVIAGFLVGGAYASSIWAACCFWKEMAIETGAHPFLIVPTIFTIVLLVVFAGGVAITPEK